MAITLQSAVGQGKPNVPADVKAVQARLVELGFSWVAVDGVVGPQTIGTIKLFQAIINGHQKVAGSGVDGVIDVNGTTHKWLNAQNAPHWQKMLAGSASDGYVNIEVADPNDDHDFGTDWIATAISAAGAHYKANHLASHADDALITVNDVSRPQGGNTTDHSTHETGMCLDMRLPRNDGTAPGSTTVNDAVYDRDAMRGMLKAFRSSNLFERILLNDQTLIGEGLCVAASGHDDHAHVDIKPPARQD